MFKLHVKDSEGEGYKEELRIVENSKGEWEYWVKNGPA